MPLEQYQRKRDFQKTPEPKGRSAGGPGGRFVVQRHRATRLRHDFRPGEDGEPWLLIKKRDEAAVEGWDPEDFPQSVKTGRTNDEVNANRDALWQSGAPAAQAEIDLSKAVAAPLPEFLEPMAATLASTP